MIERYRINRTTLWRWECQGLKFHGGRIKESHVVWFLELQEAAKVLGIKPLEITRMPREAQGSMLELAMAEKERRGARGEDIPTPAPVPMVLDDVRAE